MHLTYRLSWIADRTPGGPPKATHYRLGSAALLILTIYGLLIPLRFRPMTLDEARESFRSIAYFDPSLIGARGDWVASIVQFAALGFLLMGAIAVDRRRSVALAAAVVVAPAIVGLSCVLEFLQVYFPPRTVSWNDVVVESLGGASGVTLWLLAGPSLTGWCRSARGVRGLPALAAQLLPAYLLALVVAELMPFDFVFNARELSQKSHEGKIHLWPAASFEMIGRSALTLAMFFPMVLLLALGRKHSRAHPRWPRSLVLGLVAASLIEALQLLIYSRHFNLSDLATGPAGVALGWGAVRKIDVGRLTERLVSWLDRPATWGLLAATWLMVVAALNWQPFDFTTDPARFIADGELTDERTDMVGLRRLNLAPLVDYYWSSKYNAADQFLRKSLSFLPLGFLIGLWNQRPGRCGGAMLTMISALVVGFVIELGQYFIPERHPSTTDLLIGCFGAWLGLISSRYLGAGLRTEPILARRHS